MSFTINGKNQLLDATDITHASAHTAAPDESGSNEVTGGNYARVAITFSAADGGNKDSSNVPQLTIPAGVTVTHVGYWNASTGGQMRAFDALSVPESYGSEGKLDVTDCDLILT